MTTAPPYLMLRFRYGWKQNSRCDKVYVAASIWCQRPPSNPKLTAPNPFGQGRFLGLTLFGKRIVIERHLRAMRSAPLNTYGEFSNAASCALGLINAVESCPRPGIHWSPIIHPPSSAASPWPRLNGTWGPAYDKLCAKFGRGYEEAGWSEGERYAHIFSDVSHDIANLCDTSPNALHAGHIAQAYATISTETPTPLSGNTSDFLPDPTATAEHHRTSDPKPEPRTLKTHRPSRRRIIEL